MLHEFDEIILIRPWISQNQDHQDYQKEMFIARRGSYLSAESIALMIAEEFLLAFILLLFAILFRIPELAIAIGFVIPSICWAISCKCFAFVAGYREASRL